MIYTIPDIVSQDHGCASAKQLHKQVHKEQFTENRCACAK